MEPRKVYVIMPVLSHDTVLGCARYARLAGWNVSFQIVSGQLPREPWPCDGILSLHLNYPNLLAFLKTYDVPIVDMSPNPDGCFPAVHEDDEAIGCMAGEYFIERGFRNIAFVATNDRELQGVDRSRGLRDFIDHSPARFHLLRLDNLFRALNELPKPLALMAQDDTEARRLFPIIEKSGLRVPDDVAILGVDNDEVQCELAPVPLSSIDSDLKNRGFQAARLLDQMMAGEPVPESPILLPPKGVITRQSTDTLAVDDARVATALRYLRENYADSISIPQVAELAGMCRTRLDEKFKTYIGHTMSVELTRCRVEAARRLLVETNWKATQIAQECGFTSLNHMSVIFRKQFGCRVREFRRSETRRVPKACSTQEASDIRKTATMGRNAWELLRSTTATRSSKRLAEW